MAPGRNPVSGGCGSYIVVYHLGDSMGRIVPLQSLGEGRKQHGCPSNPLVHAGCVPKEPDSPRDLPQLLQHLGLRRVHWMESAPPGAHPHCQVLMGFVLGLTSRGVPATFTSLKKSRTSIWKAMEKHPPPPTHRLSILAPIDTLVVPVNPEV